MDQNRKKLILTVSLYLLMMGYALSSNIVGPLMKTLIDQFGISVAEGGLLAAFQGLGGVMAIVAGVFVTDRIRKSSMNILTFSIYCASMLAVSLVGTYAFLVVMFFFIGAGTKMLDVSLNANVADINYSKRGVYINLLHAAFGVGALLSPLFSAAFINGNSSTKTIFFALGMLCTLLLMVYMFTLKNTIQEEKPIQKQTAINPLVFLRDKKLVVLSIAAFLYTGFSVSISTWMPIYMQNQLNCNILISSLPVTVLWAGIVSGRLAGAVLHQKLGVYNMLVVFNFVCASVWAAAVIANNVFLIIVCAGLSGFFVGGVVPMSVSIACDWYPRFTGTVSSIILLFATAGYMVFPYIVGVLIENISLWFGILVLFVMPFFIAISILFVKIVQSKKAVEISATI